MVVTTVGLADGSAGISNENINQSESVKAKNSPKSRNIKRQHSKSPRPSSSQDDDLGNRVSFYIDDETTQMLLNSYEPKPKNIPITPVETDLRKLAALRGQHNLVRHASDVGGFVFYHECEFRKPLKSSKIRRHQSDIIRTDTKPRIPKQKNCARHFNRQYSEPVGVHGSYPDSLQRKMSQRRGSGQSIRSNIRRTDSSMSKKSNTGSQIKLPRRDLPPKERRRRTTVIVVVATFLFLLISSILVVVITLTHTSFHQDEDEADQRRTFPEGN